MAACSVIEYDHAISGVSCSVSLYSNLNTFLVFAGTLQRRPSPDLDLYSFLVRSILVKMWFPWAEVALFCYFNCF